MSAGRRGRAKRTERVLDERFATFNWLPDAVIAADERGSIVFVNEVIDLHLRMPLATHPGGTPLERARADTVAALIAVGPTS
jgi:hypothetical protein